MKPKKMIESSTIKIMDVIHIASAIPDLAMMADCAHG
jgi:hypothetical protein